jgi:hypothetical protein
MSQIKGMAFKCDCGHPEGYIEFEYDEDGIGLWVLMTGEPQDFWTWLKMWGHRKVYHSELLLNKKDVKKLIKYLEKR